MKQWSLTTLPEKLIRIGAKVGPHSKYATFQMTEVGVPQESYAAILSFINLDYPT